MEWKDVSTFSMVRHELVAEGEKLAIVQKVDKSYVVKDCVTKKEYSIKPMRMKMKEILKKAEGLLFNEWQYQEERYLYLNSLVEAKMFYDNKIVEHMS